MARVPLTKEEVAPTRLVLNVEKVGLTEEQFFQLCCDNRDLRLELSARKELIIKMPVGIKSGWRENILSTRLTIWAEKDGTGIVCSSATAYKLPNGAIRGPDSSWIRRERLAGPGAASPRCCQRLATPPCLLSAACFPRESSQLRPHLLALPPTHIRCTASWAGASRNQSTGDVPPPPRLGESLRT